jgi:hypothetical protein
MTARKMADIHPQAPRQDWCLVFSTSDRLKTSIFAEKWLYQDTKAVSFDKSVGEDHSKYIKIILKEQIYQISVT